MLLLIKDKGEIPPQNSFSVRVTENAKIIRVAYKRNVCVVFAIK